MRESTTSPSPHKRRGPAPSGRARTGSQRSAALRERAKTLVFEGGPYGEVADTHLLEALWRAYRAHLRVEVEKIAAELVRRLDQDKAVAGTDKQTPSAYPQEVRAMALAMASRGEPLSAIRAAVLAACDQTPDAATWARVLSTWQRATQG